METFYMVFLEGGNAPAFKHLREEDAKFEAERLAVKHGKETYVLKAILKLEKVVTVSQTVLGVK